MYSREINIEDKQRQSNTGTIGVPEEGNQGKRTEKTSGTIIQENFPGTSLVVQWFRFHLPMQRMQI